MSSSHIEQVKNNNHQDPYSVNKRVEVKPSEEQRAVSFQAPTPEMQEYIREHIIKPTAQAYGVNPDTGEVTPFQALGYKPEEERKRREAEMALNDRKRKENAWYNAFAVVGDSLTAALGGNVWQRQPNRIGQQAIADNARLQAEQKAEDMNNAAILRNAGAKYADTVNKLIQNYLTKTTTTNKTGGSRTETTNYGPKDGYEYRSHVVSDGNSGSGSGSGGGHGGNKVVKLAIKDKKTGKITGYKTMTVPSIYADAYSGLVQNTLQQKFENGELEDEMKALMNAGIYNPTANDSNNRWNGDKLLTYGRTFYDNALNTQMDELWKLAKEYDGKGINWIDFYDYIQNQPEVEGFDPDAKKAETEGGL